MKKLFLSFLALATIVALTSCVSVSPNTSIQINKFPEETYVVGADEQAALEAIEVAIYENGVEIKKGALAGANSVGVGITGFSLKTVGTYTAKLSYGSATVSFTYTVVAKANEVDSEADLNSALNAADEVIAVTLNDGFEIASSIKLPENKKIVLDLNGKTLKVSEEYGTDYVINIPSTSSLEIKGDGKLINEKIDVEGLFNVDGELIIQNGNFIDYSQTFNETSYYGSLLMLNANAKLTVYDGTFESLVKEEHMNRTYGKSVLYLNPDSTTKIYGGNFSNASTDGFGTPYGSYLVQSIGSLFIYGGTFIGGRGALALVGGQFDVRGGEFIGKKYYGAYVTGAVEIVNGIISGGKFIGKTSGIYTANGNIDGGNKKASSLVITGGYFESESNNTPALYFGGLSSGNLVVEGGYYKTNSKFVFYNTDTQGFCDFALAEGYELSEEPNAEGYYTIIKK